MATSEILRIICCEQLFKKQNPGVKIKTLGFLSLGRARCVKILAAEHRYRLLNNAKKNAPKRPNPEGPAAGDVEPENSAEPPAKKTKAKSKAKAKAKAAP